MRCDVFTSGHGRFSFREIVSLHGHRLTFGGGRGQQQLLRFYSLVRNGVSSSGDREIPSRKNSVSPWLKSDFLRRAEMVAAPEIRLTTEIWSFSVGT
jgi:hypothetical protein